MGNTKATDMATWITLPVLAGAYPKSHKGALLTHWVDQATGEVYCRRVQSENMADEMSASAEEHRECPTCKTCAVAWGRVGATYH